MTRLGHLRIFMIMIAAACVLACAGGRRTAVPALMPAPQRLADVAIYVDPKLDVTGYWSRNQLGRELARALKLELDAALARAGYDVSHPDPHLIARISTSLSGSTKDLSSTTVLEISHRGRVVGHFEVVSPDDGGKLSAELFPEYVAVRLANAISGSAAVAGLSLEREARDPNKEADSESETRAAVVAAFDIVDSSSQLDTEGQGQLSEYIAARMAQAMGYRFIPRVELRERLLSQKRDSYRSCFDQACQIELGKALAAQKTLATKLIRVGDTCALIATIFDLKTETAELAASVKTRCAQSSLLEGIDELVAQLHRQQLLGPGGRGKLSAQAPR